MFVNVLIQSKNKKSLKNFIQLLKRYCDNEQLKMKNFFMYRFKTIDSTFFSVLKSPHVNKTAQEQFGYILHSVQINVTNFQNVKFLIAVKELRKITGFNLNIRFKLSIAHKNNTIVEPNCKKLRITNVGTLDKNLMNTYLKSLNVYGNLKFE